MAQCSFRPKTNGRYKTKEEYRPIQERLAELQRQRSEALARARLAAETGDPELTFKPKITDTSRKIVQVRIQHITLPASEPVSSCLRLRRRASLTLKPVSREVQILY
jgi:hypothetical protein